MSQSIILLSHTIWLYCELEGLRRCSVSAVADETGSVRQMNRSQFKTTKIIHLILFLFWAMRDTM